MSDKKIDPRFLVLLVFILGAGLIRVLGAGNLMPYPNFTPIGAMALFAGAYFSNLFKSYAFPILTLFISDIIISHLIYPEYATGLLYSGWVWNYAAFALMVTVGRVIIKKVTLLRILLSALSAGLIHWIVSDFGVWINHGIDITTGKPYTYNLAGLLQCYYLALPFLKNMLVANLLYSAVFFGSFEILKYRYPKALHA